MTAYSRSSFTAHLQQLGIPFCCGFGEVASMTYMAFNHEVVPVLRISNRSTINCENWWTFRMFYICHVTWGKHQRDHLWPKVDQSKMSSVAMYKENMLGCCPDFVDQVTSFWCGQLVFQAFRISLEYHALGRYNVFLKMSRMNSWFYMMDWSVHHSFSESKPGIQSKVCILLCLCQRVGILAKVQDLRFIGIWSFSRRPWET